MIVSVYHALLLAAGHDVIDRMLSNVGVNRNRSETRAVVSNFLRLHGYNHQPYISRSGLHHKLVAVEGFMIVRVAQGQNNNLIRVSSRFK